MTNIGDKCYCCDGDLNEDDMCRLCGAARKINKSTGNVIWVRRGRLVAAFDDEREAYIVMAKRNGIPEDRWPEKYRLEGE
jgi:hypothetical protein